ncbi:YggS family pyridoxal phosphate-dependent enzyme [Cyclobacterium sediminis]|jgi:hypothetical protein
MAYELSLPQKTEVLRENYFQFIGQPIIDSFLKRGGTICLACNGRPVEDLVFLSSLGHIDFGEKYVQEGVPKLKTLKANHPQIIRQYFGKLQTNKIKAVLQNFDTIESVSSKREIDFLVKYKVPDGIPKVFFMEVNLGKEPQKNGVFEQEAEDLLIYAQDQKINISGLMTIPPKKDNPIPFFNKLRTMADRFGLEQCQMGFSRDYEMAIDCGSTRLRIGGAVFSGL